ncbi:MAG: hypothetical protein QOI54_2392, partial [Actinomycetota bacterium]|nr:hypothetical protein [Actinomycetota bacterium]
TGPAPTVSAHVPATGATAVSQTGNLTATFDKPVTGVSAATFTLHAGTAAGPAVGAASVGYDSAARLATFHPAAKLAPGTMYTAVLTSGIRDAAGQALAPTSWAFTTDPRPAVQSKSPSAAAKRVNRKANVTVRFSEKVTGVSTASFTLTTVKGAVVKATVRYNAATRTAVLDPGGPGSFKLKPRTKYTVRVTTRIKDATGNALAPMSWSFTTRA